MGLLFGRRRSILGYIPVIRWLGPLVTLFGFLGSAFMVVTGRVDLSALDQYRGTEPPAVTPVRLDRLDDKPSQLIRVATFNIQVFGQKKSSDAEVMGLIARIISQFDVVAVQEIRDREGVAMPRLVDLINRSGGRYRAVTSEPIGRTSSTESYGFIWDEQRIGLIPDSAYVVRDEADRMHREPMVATFQARVQPRDGRLPFTFTLINVHTDPDEVTNLASPSNELHVLDDVFNAVRNYEYQRTGVTDFLLLGDLNAAADRLGELGQVPDILSVAGNVPTNVRRTKTYDHILIDARWTREFNGRAGAFDIARELEVTDEVAARVSDHFPVWAEFSAYAVPDFAPVTTAEIPGTGSNR